MKSKDLIEARLKEAKRELRATRRRFAKYDNYEDMQLIDVYEKEVELLTWVLKP